MFLKPYEKTFLAFPNWYKRRINRIWPSLIAVAIVKSLIVGKSLTFMQGIFYHGYWFIDCIMVYYLAIFIIGTFWKWNYLWIYIFVSGVTFIWFFFMEKPAGYSMYEPGSIIKWLPYFLFMLMGAQLGKSEKNRSNDLIDKRRHPYVFIFLFVLFAAMYYIILGVSVKMSCLQWLQPFSFIPLLPCSFYIYKFVCCASIDKLIRHKYGVIACVGGLCLEIYLVADFFITDRFNAYFPISIIVVVFLIIVSAYFLRCFARLIAQTFKESPYDYKEILKLY